MGRIGLTSQFLPSMDATIEWGKSLSAFLPKRSILALSGHLGSGKTTFVQGLALGLGILEPVQSPTFTLLHLYEGLLAHFDLYRLKNSSDFTALGFEEHWDAGYLCAIEWPEKILDILPAHAIRIHFTYEREGRLAQIL